MCCRSGSHTDESATTPNGQLQVELHPGLHSLCLRSRCANAQTPDALCLVTLRTAPWQNMAPYTFPELPAQRGRVEARPVALPGAQQGRLLARSAGDPQSRHEAPPVRCAHAAPLPATETWDTEKWSTHGTWRQRIWWMDW